ncbi:unnamed protein product [Amaranthus hypochondriacus]
MGSEKENQNHRRWRSNGCWAIVKEQRSRFYIARKCIWMLLCWHFKNTN